MQSLLGRRRKNSRVEATEARKGYWEGGETREVEKERKGVWEKRKLEKWRFMLSTAT